MAIKQRYLNYLLSLAITDFMTNATYTQKELFKRTYPNFPCREKGIEKAIKDFPLAVLVTRTMSFPERTCMIASA
ncbi:MAG: hypothetical protein Q8P40_00475 [Nitrospirota bacterium]|nr:hypothetical protein [Nitrospirota bacterium]